MTRVSQSSTGVPLKDNGFVYKVCQMVLGHEDCTDVFTDV